VKIQYTFEVETSQGLVKDALYFYVGEFEKMTDEEVALTASSRAKEWEQNMINAKLAEEEPYTEEELLKLKQELELQIADLQSQKTEIEASLNVK
jgi:ferredoxin-fold anticodon binding domain-containing protein